MSLTIQALRDCVKNFAMIEHKFPDVDYTQTPEEVDEEITQYGGKINGHIIDVQTANALLTVYDAFQEERHKEKFVKMLETWTNFEKLVSFAWKCIK